MLEQLQTGAASEATIASVKEGGKTAKAGVFANLFSALTHSKGKAAKGKIISAIGAEKHTALKSALAAKAEKGSKLQAAKHANVNIGKTEHSKKTKSLQTAQTPLATTSAQKKKSQEETPAAIALPVVTTTASMIKNQNAAKEQQPHQTTGDKKNMRNADKRETHTAKLLTLADKNENTTRTTEQRPTQTTTIEKQEIANTPVSDKQDKHVTITARTNENIRTESAPGLAAQAYEKTAATSLHGSIEQQTRLQQDNPDNKNLKRNKLQNSQNIESGKHRQDAQTNITQQALLAARSQANNVKSGNTTSPSAPNGSANHVALVNLLNQNAGQLADQQQGNSQFGQGQSSNALSDSGARQDVADSRFSGLLQSEARSPTSLDANSQRIIHAGYPLKALEAMRHIAQSAKNGATRLELQLEPAHLGKIHVSLQTDAAKQLQMHLTVEQAMTRQVIEQHLPQLRAALEQQGLSLDQFSLQTGSQQQHAAQDQSFSGQTDQQRQSNDVSSASAQSEIPINTQAAAHGRLSIHI